jgi:hypothetical protein
VALDEETKRELMTELIEEFADLRIVKEQIGAADVPKLRITQEINPSSALCRIS